MEIVKEYEKLDEIDRKIQSIIDKVEQILCK